jgi:predicted aspartyl protease
VEFDFPGHKMRFHNLGGYSYQGPTKPIELKQKKGLYYVELKINGKEKDLLVDTGASGALAIPVSAKELEAALHFGATKKTLKGAHGESTEAYVGVAEPFEIGSYTIADAKIRYYDKKDGFDLEGILGMSIFKEFTLIIDTDNLRMYLEAYEEDVADIISEDIPAVAPTTMPSKLH